jgi:hypothetical protein
MAKLREGRVDAGLAQARTVHGEILEVNRNEAQAIRDGEIVKLNSQLELQNGKLNFQTKMQNFAFAVQNVEANFFNYYYGKITCYDDGEY